MLCAIEVAQGRTVPENCREHAISEQFYYRWRAEFGDSKLDQAKRLKELERENQRLRRAVADVMLDKLILQGRSAGKPLIPERHPVCAAQFQRTYLGASERRACRVLGQVRSTQRHIPVVPAAE
ncbi:hypothetical protein J2Y49_001479 [Azospirillum sp. BE72]|nr:hypothetical protein [Azospirillum sp. BE72]